MKLDQHVLNDAISMGLSNDQIKTIPTAKIRMMCHLYRQFNITAAIKKSICLEKGNYLNLSPKRLNTSALYKIINFILEQNVIIRTLDLSLNRIDIIPDSLSLLIYMQCLDLSNNKLKMIPTSFKNLQSLVSLNLAKNKFEKGDLIQEVGNITDLNSLNSANNNLNKILQELKHLSNLQFINLAENNIHKTDINIIMLDKAYLEVVI
tara:strand:- start:1476 stop:2096 length:621 start_codon:yes stop_codon:yes gene_type:complete